jgi:hypothetical protein
MISLVLTLLVLGVILYLIETLVHSRPIKLLIRIVIVVFAILLMIRAFGVADIPIR